MEKFKSTGSILTKTASAKAIHINASYHMNNMLCNGTFLYVYHSFIYSPHIAPTGVWKPSFPTSNLFPFSFLAGSANCLTGPDCHNQSGSPLQSVPANQTALAPWVVFRELPSLKWSGFNKRQSPRAAFFWLVLASTSQKTVLGLEVPLPSDN